VLSYLVPSIVTTTACVISKPENVFVFPPILARLARPEVAVTTVLAMVLV